MDDGNQAGDEYEEEVTFGNSNNGNTRSGFISTKDSAAALLQRIRFLQFINKEREKSGKDGDTRIKLTKSLEDIANAYYSKTKRKDAQSSSKVQDVKKKTNCKKKVASGDESETFEPDYIDFPRSKKSPPKKKKKKKRRKVQRKSPKKSSESTQSRPVRPMKSQCTQVQKDEEEEEEEETYDQSETPPPSTTSKKKKRKQTIRTKSVGTSDCCPQPPVNSKRKSGKKSCHDTRSISVTPSPPRKSSSRSKSKKRKSNCTNNNGKRPLHVISKSRSRSFCCEKERRESPPRRRPPRRKTRRSLFHRLFTHLGLLRKNKRSCDCDCGREEKRRKVNFNDTCSKSPPKKKKKCGCQNDEDDDERRGRRRPSDSTKCSREECDQNGWNWKDALFGSSSTREENEDDSCKHKCLSPTFFDQSGNDWNYQEPKFWNHHVDGGDRIDFNKPSIVKFGENRIRRECPLHSTKSKSFRRQDDCEEENRGKRKREEVEEECECPFCPFQYGDELKLNHVRVSPICGHLISKFVTTELGEMLEEKLNGLEETLQEEERKYWAEYVREEECPLCSSRHKCELHS